MPGGQRLAVYKNNSDGKGNSYGTHENYLVDRAVPFASLVVGITPFFVSRQVFTGAGKLGAEASWDDRTKDRYQVTQRADFFEAEVGLETTLKRPIVKRATSRTPTPRSTATARSSTPTRMVMATFLKNHAWCSMTRTMRS
jgi:hypothetical protein